MWVSEMILFVTSGSWLSIFCPFVAGLKCFLVLTSRHSTVYSRHLVLQAGFLFLMLRKRSNSSACSSRSCVVPPLGLELFLLLLPPAPLGCLGGRSLLRRLCPYLLSRLPFGNLSIHQAQSDYQQAGGSSFGRCAISQPLCCAFPL